MRGPGRVGNSVSQALMSNVGAKWKHAFLYQEMIYIVFTLFFKSAQF